MLFAYEPQPVTEDQAKLISTLRELFSTVQEAINELPDSKYKSKASTDLEIVAMLVTKAITHANKTKT